MKKRWITVDGKVATSATWISGGEEISLVITEEVRAGSQLIFQLSVLFEDDYLAIIHKPAGILVSGNSFKTITNALAQNLLPSKLPDATQPQPVHRLDYATTGILLIGKTSSSIRALNQLFADKLVTKTYYAVTIGIMDKQGEISSAVDGKPAQSKYQLRASVPSKRFGQLNLVELSPQTGRRHQLRKHLSSIGHPVLGDKDYGIDGLILHGKGMYLHAYALGFTHPFTEAAVSFTSEIPRRFKKLFPSLK